MSDTEQILQEAKQKLKYFVKAVNDSPSKFTPSTGTLWTILSASRTKPKAPPPKGIYGYAEHVFGWIALNPNDLERGRALVSTYHLPGFENFDPINSTLDCLHPVSNEYGNSNNGSQTTKTIPSLQGLLSLFDCVTISQSRFIAISGRRGSGKTMALNFFLATAHKKLESRGVLWFRTDIAKLWANRNSLNVTQYTILHSIYIALRYATQDENLKPMKSIDGVPGKLFKDFLDKPEVSQRIRDMWEELVKAYAFAIRFEKEKPVAEFLRQCKELITKDNEKTILDIYVVFKTFLKESAKEQAIKILIILDGVDNVRVGAEQERYFDLLDEINDLFLGVPIRIGDQYLLVARPETFVDLTYRQTSKGHVSSAPSVFEIDSDFISGLIEKKEKAMLSPSDYFKRLAEAYDGEKQITQEDIRDFSNSIKFLLNAFEAEGKRSLSLNSTPNILENVTPLDMIFDGNIRSMLRNAIRAHYHKKRLPNVKMERALIEGSILAGYTFTPSNNDDNVHGRWCPNLFEEATFYQEKWTGLVMVRLIQLLSAVKDGVTSDDVIKFLHNNFNYQPERIKMAFQTALEFSLIRAIDYEHVFDDKLGRTRKHSLFSTTLKGRCILKMGLEDYAIYYFMALATPLDVNKLLTLKHIDFKLLIHSDSDNANDVERHFFRSAILLGMTLWAHIQVADQKECDALPEGNMSVNEEMGTTVSCSAFELKNIINNLPILAEEFLDKINNKTELNIVSETLEKLAI